MADCCLKYMLLVCLRMYRVVPISSSWWSKGFGSEATAGWPITVCRWCVCSRGTSVSTSMVHRARDGFGYRRPKKVLDLLSSRWLSGCKLKSRSDLKQMRSGFLNMAPMQPLCLRTCGSCIQDSRVALTGDILSASSPDRLP